MDADQWQLGARWSGTGRTEFLVWAPHARRVDVRLLGPREQVVPLSPCGQGYYAAAVHDSAPGAHYFYRLDDRLERADPASRLQPSGVNGPSEIVDSAFDWHDADWPGLALADYVLYELHVGTFSPEGTLAGVTGQLDRLVELGITAIELMPLAQFPGSRNWGYDGVYPWAVQNSYGGPRELKRLVDACHRRGLGVVLDVVYNHLGPEGNYLSDFGPYFNAQHQTPWGPAINFEGPDSDAVRRYFLDSALMWVREFHVDGLRLDAIHAIVDRSARPFLAELSDRVHAAAAELRRPVQLIAENNRNDPRIFAAAQRGGLGLDAQWLDDFGRALQGRLTGERTGFYADFGRVADIAAAWRGGYVLDGRYSNYRRRRHGASSSAVPRERFFVYSQMHDQVGNRPQSDRLSTLVGLEQLKLAAATILLSPYQPLLFMGEEYGEPAPFHYFVSHLDPGLIERVRAGRRREFAAFHWQKEPADPQADSTFAASRLNHDLARSGWHAVLWNFYRELLRLRRELPAPACGSKSINQGAASGTAKTLSWESPPLLAAARADQNGQALVLLNFGPTAIRTPPAALWRGGPFTRLLESSEAAWLGSGSTAPATWHPAESATIGPWGAVVYRRPAEAGAATSDEPPTS